MVYKYFEHRADVGIIGIGKTLEESFQEAAKAMFKVMSNIAKVKDNDSVRIKVEAKDEEELFVEWLNELLAQIDLKRMMFSKFEVRIKKSENRFVLTGKAYGEKINPKKHQLKTEVKAATYSQLKIKKEKNKYTSQCVVDV